MSSFIQGLKDKIEVLKDERDELEGSISRIDAKIETLEELLTEEEGAFEEKPAPKRKRGRPKGSKVKPKVDPRILTDYETAVRELGDNATTPEEQARKVKSFRPSPKPQGRRSPNVKAGTKKEVFGNNKSDDARISIEDDE